MDWKRILPLLTTLAATTLLGAILGGTITGAIFAGSATSPPPTPQASGPQTCNNQPAYCTRSYSNVTQIGSHDSAFVGPLLQQNQNLPITQQLDLGIRFLQAQTHKDPIDHSIIQLCHTSCFLEDAGSLESYLSTIKAWLDSHSDEVVTLLLTNGDGFSASSFGDVFESSGVKKYAFVPESSSDVLSIHDWPTLGHLIENGTRLIVFLDYGANTSQVPYILDEFSYFFETPYDVTDPAFSRCKIDRPPNASPDGRMYIVNHFLDVDVLGIKIPDREKADQTNAATGKGSIGAQCQVCEGLYGREPNVVLVDFVDKGNVMKAQKILNGLAS